MLPTLQYPSPNLNPGNPSFPLFPPKLTSVFFSQTNQNVSFNLHKTASNESIMRSSGHCQKIMSSV
jgi:hypothetical protein